MGAHRDEKIGGEGSNPLMIAKFLIMGISKLSPEQLLYVQNCLDVFFISGNILYVLYYIFPLLFLGG